MKHKLIGELVRYSADRPNAIMQVDNVDGDRVYGMQLMGGRTGANYDDLTFADESDWDAWDTARWFRNGINGRMGHG